MSDTNPAFNEESLKASIEAMWGKYGAHADVFRHMLLTLRRYQAQDDAVYHLIRSARDLKDNWEPLGRIPGDGLNRAIMDICSAVEELDACGTSGEGGAGEQVRFVKSWWCALFGHAPSETEAVLWGGRTLTVKPYCPRCLKGTEGAGESEVSE